MTPSPAGPLFERHHLAVFRFLRRSTGDASLAEDLTQEVFLKVVKGLDAYEERSNERAWIFRIARNVLVDDHRRRQRMPHRVSLEDGRLPILPPRQGLHTSLEEALDNLPEYDREAFLMREVGGLGYDEIAVATDVTRDAVRMRIYRARIALRKSLGARSSLALSGTGGSN